MPSVDQVAVRKRIAVLDGWRGIAVLVSLGLSLIATVRFVQLLKSREHISADVGLLWTHTDLMPVWRGSQLVLHRENPYSESATHSIQIDYYGRALTHAEEYRWNKMGFAYPPYSAFIFAGLAILPWPWASWTFLLFAPILTILSVLAWKRLVIARRGSAILIAAILASWPFLWGLRLENVSLLVIPMIAGACFWLRHRPALAGILLAASTVKPQLVFVLIPFLLLWAVRRRAWRFAISFILTFSALLAASTVFLPGWIALWRASVIDYVAYRRMSPILPAYLAIPLLIVVGVALWRRREDIGFAISLALAATVVFMPIDFATTYNYLLLVPASFVLLGYERLRFPVGELRMIALAVIGAEFALPVIAVTVQLLSHNRVILYGGMNLILLLPIAITVALLAYGLPVKSADCSASVQRPD